MPFNPPQQNDLLPLLLQHTLNQRAREEERAFEEERLTRTREEGALDIAVRAVGQGLSADEAISLAGSFFPADRMKALKGIERARKQQQKAQEEQSRISPLAEGMAAQISQIQTGAAHPQSLTTMLEGLQGLSPETLSAVTSEAQARLSANQANIQSGRPITFYNPNTGQQVGQARPGTPEYERLAGNQGLTTFEPTGTPEQVFGIDKVAKREAQKQLIQNISNRRDTAELIRTIKSADARAFGVRPMIASAVGSILANADPLDPTLREQVMQALSGVSVSERRNLYVQSQIAVASAVSAITAERSGRVTTEERAITDEALRLTGPLSTQADALEAMELVYVAQTANANFLALSGGMKPLYPVVRRDAKGNLVRDKAAERKLLDDATRAGLSDANIERLARVIRGQHEDALRMGF